MLVYKPVLTYLMNVVVNMLACNGRCDRMSLLSTAFGTDILKLSSLLLQASLNSCRVTVVLLTVLDWNNIVVMLFWQDFPIFDRLDRGVVVILMHLPIDCSLRLFMPVLGHVFVDHGRSNFLVHGSVMMTSLVPVYRELVSMIH